MDFIDRLLESDRQISGGQVLGVTVQAEGTLAAIVRDIISARHDEGVEEEDWSGEFDQAYTLLLDEEPTAEHTATRHLTHRLRTRL